MQWKSISNIEEFLLINICRERISIQTANFYRDENQKSPVKSSLPFF